MYTFIGLDEVPDSAVLLLFLCLYTSLNLIYSGHFRSLGHLVFSPGEAGLPNLLGKLSSDSPLKLVGVAVEGHMNHVFVWTDIRIIAYHVTE